MSNLVKNWEERFSHDVAHIFQHQLKQMIGIFGGGTIGFIGYCVYSGNEKFYREYVMPVIKLVDPETTHNLAVTMAKYRLVPKQKKPDPPILVSALVGN